jgi:hypothetical protein
MLSFVYHFNRLIPLVLRYRRCIIRDHGNHTVETMIHRRDVCNGTMTLVHTRSHPRTYQMNRTFELYYAYNIKNYTCYRFNSTTRKKPKNRPRTATTTKKVMKTIPVDENGYEEPCMENGFGYVIYKPRFGYPDGLYGVGSFGCTYHRHPKEPADSEPDVYEIQILIEQRVHCKMVRDYTMADTIEEELKVLHNIYLDDKEKLWTTRRELISKQTKAPVHKATPARKDD